MATYDVTNASELTQAFTQARGGDTIRLAAGDYGDVVMRNVKPDGMVTLVSADLSNKAHFDTLLVRTSQNLTFRGIDIGRPLVAGEADHTQMAQVRESSRIVMDQMHFHGSLDGNAQNDGYGLLADKVTAFTVINSQFTQASRGLVVSSITNLQVSGNRFNDMRTDGIDTDGSKNVVIENNVFQGFYPFDYDHPDAMQFHNLGHDSPTENVTVRNNVLLPGGTYGPQGVWVSDPGTTGFRNFLIENNVLWSHGSYNGIGLNGVTGAVVRGNTVLSPTTDNKVFWIRVRNSSDIDLIKNISEDVIIESTATDVRQDGNANLRLSPALRDQMANFNNPQSAADVILANYGFQLPAANSPEAPVSGAVGSMLRDLLSPNGGTSFTSTLAEDDSLSQTSFGAALADDDSLSSAFLNLSRLSEIVGAAPVEEVTSAPLFEFDLAPPPMSVYEYTRDVVGDWFVALP